MAAGRHQNPGEDEGASPGATEPITLTDPDGAVTLVAPWSTWTREQVRAPGGEPALVTRLDQGQLWFSAGRLRSPWRHEVRIGSVSVSASEGRFHVTAEPDGGATVDCLAGRTRVVAGLQEPVVLEPEQTAAVASDAGTLLVLDDREGRVAPRAAGPTPKDPLAPEVESAVPPEVDAGANAAGAAAIAAGRVAPPLGDHGVGSDGGDGEVVPGADELEPPRRSRIPEIVSVAALLAVLLAAVVVFGRQPDTVQQVEVAAPSTTDAPATTEEPTTTAPRTTSTSTTSTTVKPVVTTTTSPPALVNPAIASGSLASCKRAAGGVLATINVSLESGGPGRFDVGVGLVGADGQVFARGEARSAMIPQGSSAPVDVLVAVPGQVRGACQLLGVEAA